MKNLYFEKNGNTWLGHIVGTENEIELAHNSLYNNCGTNTRNLDMIDPNHGTFWTTEKAMRNYLVKRNLNIILNSAPNSGKGKKGGALAEARALAAEQFAGLTFEQPRCFASAAYEYQFSEVKEVQKVENFQDYLVDKARGL